MWDSDSRITQEFKINNSLWQKFSSGECTENASWNEKGCSCYDKISQPQSPETFMSWPSRSLLLSLSEKRSPLATQSINTTRPLHASHSRLLQFAHPPPDPKYTQQFSPHMGSKCAWQFYDYRFVINSINSGTHKTQGFCCSGILVHSPGNFIYWALEQDDVCTGLSVQLH